MKDLDGEIEQLRGPPLRPKGPKLPNLPPSSGFSGTHAEAVPRNMGEVFIQHLLASHETSLYITGPHLIPVSPLRVCQRWERISIGTPGL